MPRLEPGAMSTRKWAQFAMPISSGKREDERELDRNSTFLSDPLHVPHSSFSSAGPQLIPRGRETRLTAIAMRERLDWPSWPQTQNSRERFSLVHLESLELNCGSINCGQAVERRSYVGTCQHAWGPHRQNRKRGRFYRRGVPLNIHSLEVEESLENPRGSYLKFVLVLVFVFGEVRISARSQGLDGDTGYRRFGKLSCEIRKPTEQC